MDAEREDTKACDTADDCAVERKPSKGERFERLTVKVDLARRKLRQAQHSFREAQDNLAFFEDLAVERERELRLFVQSTGGL